KVWDVATGLLLRTLTGHTNAVFSVAFSPDGSRLAASSLGGVIKVWAWDTAVAQDPLTLKGHTSSVYGVAFSPDGLGLASGSLDGTIKVWDARSDPEARSFEGRNVAFSPDGKWLASTSWSWATTFTVWDTSTGKKTRTFTGHSDHVVDVAFSPDG